MATNLIHSTCCFVIFILFIGHGDGRWKNRDKEKLYEDIDVFKRMAEKIEREIEAFYEDYPDEEIKGADIENVHQEYIKKLREHKSELKKVPDRNETHEFSYIENKTLNIPNSKSEYPAYTKFNQVSFKNKKVLKVSNSNWPKFEDILLEMGRKYDWKNDRWIKIKRKLKKPTKKDFRVDSSINFHEKHKFSYRTVKLNRKSRRNVVIAVTAVR